MKIEAVYLYAYELPFARPLSLGGQRLTSRRGLILRVRTNAGIEAIGEIAPIPGMSHENFEAAQAECTWWMYRILDTEVPLRLIDLVGGEQLWDCVAPSVQFGLSCMAAMLKARSQGLEAGQLFSRKQRTEVSVNALVNNAGDEAVGEAQEAAALGYRAIKLKVGRASLDDDIATVEAVRTALDDSIALRLDANGRWTFKEAEEFAQGVRGLNVEFIEEPVDYWKLLFPFRLYTRLEYGVDETLMRFRDDLLHAGDDATDTVVESAEGRQHMRQTMKRARAHVIKPMLFGGLKHVSDFVSNCSKPWHATPVICAVFESGIGRIMLANLAATIDDHDIPIGIESDPTFAGDILSEPLPIHDGRMDLAKANPLLDRIDYESLELIAME